MAKILERIAGNDCVAEPDKAVILEFVSFAVLAPDAGDILE